MKVVIQNLNRRPLIEIDGVGRESLHLTVHDGPSKCTATAWVSVKELKDAIDRAVAS